MPEGRHEGQGHWMDDRGSLLCAGDRDVLVKRAYLHKDFKIQKKKRKKSQTNTHKKEEEFKKKAKTLAY